MSIAEAMKEKDYWIQNHVDGDRFEGPISLFSLDELCDIMEVPTDYISPLDQTAWYNYYIAPLSFRGVSTSLCNTQILLNHFFGFSHTGHSLNLLIVGARYILKTS